MACFPAETLEMGTAGHKKQLSAHPHRLGGLGVRWPGMCIHLAVVFLKQTKALLSGASGAAARHEYLPDF